MSINKVRVTGEIYVPATGADLVTNGTFDADTDWNKIGDATISGGTGNFVSAGDFLIQSVVPLTVRTYLLKYEIISGSGTFLLSGGNSAFGVVSLTSTVGTHSKVVTSNGTQQFLQLFSSSFIGSIDNVELFELTIGPVDVYPWDSQTDYSAGGEPLGILNGERVYKSEEDHADGVGGSEAWNIWWDNVSDWILSPEAGTEGANYWSLTDSDVIGDYTENGLAAGTATVSIAEKLIASVFGGVFDRRLFNEFFNNMF